MYEQSSCQSFMHNTYLKKTLQPCILLSVTLSCGHQTRSIDLSRSCHACYKCIQLESCSLPVSFTLKRHSLAVATFPPSELKYTWIYMYNLRERVECTHLKFSVSGQSKQTNINLCVQCSHASVRLAQACSNITW